MTEIDTPQVWTTSIGDGQAHQFTVAHGLDNPQAMVTIYDKDTGAQVQANLTWLDANTVAIDTGGYFCLYERPKLGPLPLPWTTPKLGVIPGSIPEPDSLQVVVVG